MSSSPSDQQTVKLYTAPFAVLINSYLLKSSMTPQKLSKLARKKYQLDNKNRNLRKRVLNRIIYKSVTKYTIWSNKRQTVNNIDSETKPKRAYIKIVNRKRKTDGNKSDSTVKKQKLDKNDGCQDDNSNDVENLQQEDKENEPEQ